MVVPSPRLSETLVAATRMTVVGVAPMVVAFSKAKFPVKVWPATVRATPVASTRMNGPAGSVSAMVSEPMVKFSATATEVLLMETWTVAARETDGTFSSAIVALTRPARPALVTRKVPDPPLTTT